MNVGQLIWKQETEWDKSPASIRISPHYPRALPAPWSAQTPRPLYSLFRLARSA